MPFYEFECDGCGKPDIQDLPVCKRDTALCGGCGSRLRRVFSVPMVVNVELDPGAIENAVYESKINGAKVASGEYRMADQEFLRNCKPFGRAKLRSEGQLIREVAKEHASNSTG